MGASKDQPIFYFPAKSEEIFDPVGHPMPAVVTAVAEDGTVDLSVKNAADPKTGNPWVRRGIAFLEPGDPRPVENITAYATAVTG